MLQKQAESCQDKACLQMRLQHTPRCALSLQGSMQRPVQQASCFCRQGFAYTHHGAPRSAEGTGHHRS